MHAQTRAIHCPNVSLLNSHGSREKPRKLQTMFKSRCGPMLIAIAHCLYKHLWPIGITACVLASVKQMAQGMASEVGPRVGSEFEALNFRQARLWLSDRLRVIP